MHGQVWWRQPRRLRQAPTWQSTWDSVSKALTRETDRDRDGEMERDRDRDTKRETHTEVTRRVLRMFDYPWSHRGDRQQISFSLNYMSPKGAFAF